MLKPKVGDLVRLKPLIVKELNYLGNTVLLSIEKGPTNSCWMHSDLIEEILPRPLAVGDRVQERDQHNKDAFAIVIGIDDDVAWLKWSGGHPDPQWSRNWCPLANLVRIDEP